VRTRAEAQIIADVYGCSMYQRADGVWTNVQCEGDRVEPTVKSTLANLHGLGPNMPTDYATPNGDGTKL
jgi:hypothetical protein